MPGVHSTTPEMIQQLSRLSPEIGILEHEPDEAQMGSNLFEMFSSHFSASSGGASNSSAIVGANTTGSSGDKPGGGVGGGFPEISVFPHHSQSVQQSVHLPAARDGLDSFQFLRHSMFDESHRAHGEKNELEESGALRASPSSAELEAPIAKLWTAGGGGGEYEEHHYSDGGGVSCEQQPYESLDANNCNLRARSLSHPGSFKAGNSSGWGVSRSSTVVEPTATITTNAKPKRKRSRPCKSSEEVESQRMTHIAVERNRRKQMNEHLRVLRGLMPGSYVQRGDQASIIGGAIEFVKELQHILHCLEDQKKRKMSLVETPVRLLGSPSAIQNISGGFPYNNSPAASAATGARGIPPVPLAADVKFLDPTLYNPVREFYGEAETPLAKVEVKIVGLAAFIRIWSQKKPGQLLRIMTALENKLLLTIVHINVTTIDPSVLYAFEVKIGHSCGTADELAAFVHHTLESASLEIEDLQLHEFKHD